MTCPVCGSSNVHVGCCGDTTAECRNAKCRYRWEAEVSEPCLVPKEEPHDEPIYGDFEAGVPYTPLDNGQLWGM